MFARALRRATATRTLLVSLVLAPGASPLAAEAEADNPVRTKVSQDLSFGGMVRVTRRDPGLIGGGNGGTGTSVNFDDGNLNYDRGLTALAVQGRTVADRQSAATELKVEAVYFYDSVNAHGETEFRPLSEAARERVGHDLYLNEAYVGFKGGAADAIRGARLGNQIQIGRAHV